MASHMVRQGHQVTMICGRYTGGITGLDGAFHKGCREGTINGINVIEFDLEYSNSDGFLKRTYLFIEYAVRSVMLALTRKYDVVFATSTPLTAGIPGIFSKWLRGKPFIFEVRDLWPELPREMGVIRNPVILGLMSILEWLSYRSASRLIGLSPGIVDGIARRGISREKIALIPNGCDLNIFHNIESQWRPDGVGKSDLLAIFTGAHGVANGLDAVLDAAAELNTRGRDDIKIVLIGQGKLKSNLIERVKRDSLGNVLFHDPVDKATLAGLLASADIGLQILANVPAFYFGTSPNKFFDYIAAGLPVLTNYPGWLANIIRLHECGFAVDPEDSGAFADALEMAADDRNALKTMGARGRVLAEAQYSRADLAAQFENWLIGSIVCEH